MKIPNAKTGLLAESAASSATALWPATSSATAVRPVPPTISRNEPQKSERLGDSSLTSDRIWKEKYNPK